MGKPGRIAALRGAGILAAAALVFLPLRGIEAAPPPEESAPILTTRLVNDVEPPLLPAERWSDEHWGLSLVPPTGWVRSPAGALNPISDPPDPVFEIVRFQLRVGDASLYAQPVALTSGLLADARAVLSIGVVREGSGLVGWDPDKWEETSRVLPGFVASDDDVSYEGLRTFTRYFHATASDRVVVVRLMAGEDEWQTVRLPLLGSLSSLRADPAKPNGPAAPLPPPPPAPPAVEEVVVDPSIEIRGRMLARAASMLAIPYVWGGNSTTRGMDCSAWVSRVWGVERYSTDSIGHVSFPITKSELLPGDALNLTTGRDPRRLGHIRLFEAWANAARTLMWVYEATPPQSIHRVIAYDDRYQPIRLSGLSGDGVALIIPGTPAPERTSPPRVARPTIKATPRPTIKVTPRPTFRPTARPTSQPTVRPTLRATPRPTPRLSTWPPPTPTPTSR